MCQSLVQLVTAWGSGPSWHWVYQPCLPNTSSLPKPYWQHRPVVGGCDQPQQLPSLSKTAAKAKTMMQNALREDSDYFELSSREKMLLSWVGGSGAFFFNIFSKGVVDAELFCSLPSLLASKLLSMAYSSCNSSSPFQMLHHVMGQENQAVSSCFLHKLQSWGSSAITADSRKIQTGPKPYWRSVWFENPSSVAASAKYFGCVYSSGSEKRSWVM